MTKLLKNSKLKKALIVAAALYCAAFMVIAGSFAASRTSDLFTLARPSAVSALANDGVVGSVLEVFTEIGSWIAENVPTWYTLFYVEAQGLTFLGVLAVASLAFSVCFLMFGIVTSFLRFR